MTRLIHLVLIKACVTLFIIPKAFKDRRRIKWLKKREALLRVLLKAGLKTFMVRLEGPLSKYKKIFASHIIIGPARLHRQYSIGPYLCLTWHDTSSELMSDMAQSCIGSKGPKICLEVIWHGHDSANIIEIWKSNTCSQQMLSRPKVGQPSDWSLQYERRKRGDPGTKSHGGSRKLALF